MGAPTLVSVGVGLAVVSAVFWIIERWRPALPAQRRRAVDTRVDLAHWFFTPLVTRAAVATRQTWASALPIWIQAPLILLLADLLAYWTHRMFHARWLWPFHAIHHSSTTVDWLSSVRLHPVNDVVARVVQVLPLYLMFGTFYMPPGRQPREFGIAGGGVPDGLLAQLAYPFRRRASRPQA